MKTAGLVLGSFLVLSLFLNAGLSEAKHDTKSSTIKKDIKEFTYTNDNKSVKITKIIKSRTLHAWLIVEVQICAGAEKLYSPDLEIKSDRDTIDVTVWGLIMPKSCRTNEFFIRADDPNSITVSFSNPNYREPTK
ncbi:MAG: hypothetical protein HZC29_01615 [Thaumarchaeota archaeon]|nr:hypothetical protein [Nitrososphaerota archaeon]